jgi:hypothetical protein
LEYTRSREPYQNACEGASTGDVLVFGCFFLVTGKAGVNPEIDAGDELSGAGCECHEV